MFSIPAYPGLSWLAQGFVFSDVAVTVVWQGVDCLSTGEMSCSRVLKIIFASPLPIGVGTEPTQNGSWSWVLELGLGAWLGPGLGHVWGPGTWTVIIIYCIASEQIARKGLATVFPWIVENTETLPHVRPGSGACCCFQLFPGHWSVPYIIAVAIFAPSKHSRFQNPWSKWYKVDRNMT